MSACFQAALSKPKTPLVHFFADTDKTFSDEQGTMKDRRVKVLVEEESRGEKLSF